MPNTSPTKNLLRKLGLNIPEDDDSPIDKGLQNKIALESQEKDPTWKKVGRAGIDVASNLVKGAIGIEPHPDESYAGRKANLGSQALQAGLPLSAITKGRSIFHGTTKAFNRFDPSKANPRGTLSNLVNAAENPYYANMYSGGLSDAIKGGVKGTSPNTIAIRPDAKNVLDLADPNPDDLSHALGSLHPFDRRTLIDDFKMSKRFPDDLDEGETPLNKLAMQIQNSFDEDSSAIGKTLFDAIRYDTPGGPSVGLVPGRAPMKTPWGVDVSPTATPKTPIGELVGIGKRFPKFISPKRK